jgi:hypothetical protein
MDNYDYQFTRRRDRGMDPTLKIVLIILAVPIKEKNKFEGMWANNQVRN